uniref:Uncharacterized protein n=1 Tax=Manihot esculenta TaxID=3983 RepID=A0A2C9V194_MANES
MNVMVYFTKFKKVWDELSCVRLFLVCTCGAAKEMSEICESDKLIQFLIGLNSLYDHIRNQILLLDLFSLVNQAHAMVLRIEKQREANTFTPDVTDGSMAMMAKTQGNNRENTSYKTSFKRRETKKKEERFCDHCKNTRHNKDSCFKLIRYPKWFKQKKMKQFANAVEDTCDSTLEVKPGKARKEELTVTITSII